MINLDTRLIDLLNGDELAVFIHILKRIGKNNKSFPSRYTLQQETDFGRRRVADAIAGLKQKKIIETIQENKNGNFGKTIYKIKTDLAGVYITAKNEEIEEKDSKNGGFDRDTGNRTTVNRTTVNRTTETGQVSINQDKYYSDQEINNIKCVKNEKNTLPNFENFKKDILTRFAYYEKFDLKYYFERVKLYLMQNPKNLNDFTAYVVSFMLGDQTGGKAVYKKESCALTVYGNRDKVLPELRQQRFKNYLFNTFSHRYKKSDLEAFYSHFSAIDSKGVLLIEKSKRGLTDTLINAYLKQAKPA